MEEEVCAIKLLKIILSFKKIYLCSVVYSSSNLNVPNSLYTDIAFLSLSKIDMHVNKVSVQELVQGMRMRVECKKEKKRMSVDIFRKKRGLFSPSHMSTPYH